MNLYRMLIIALIAGMLFLSQSASSITVSVSSNAGGFTEVIDAGFNDKISGSTIIGSDRLSNSIQGNANLNESHSVSNKAGATAEVGVDIRNAEWYSYSYDLWPGQGSSWKASKYPLVTAGEDLDVLNASYIEAYASATSPQGYNAGVSTVISDPGNEASLTGYSNLAMASKNEAFASQTADWASSPNGYIQAEASADFTQLKPKPLRFREDKAESNTRVDSGSIEGYSDLASASAIGLAASQQQDAVAGEEIQTGSLASSKSASLFQSLKIEKASVNTRAEGSLTGYNSRASSLDGSVSADQTGHIVGSFTSSALAGSASKTKSSNYGDIYDFSMQAKKDGYGSYVSGTLGYYVDNVSPTANRIQGALDASESGDIINILPGIYIENVVVNKSLDILGTGADETIVDGNQEGSVFKIGETDSDIDVTLSGLAIINGSGTLYYGYDYLGGGIYNEGRATIRDCFVNRNTASYFGGGVYNQGTITITKSNVSENSASYSGGIYNGGNATIEDSTISGNSAYIGGGIYNEGMSTITNSTMSGNRASYGGGGRNNGMLTITDSIISENQAEYGGGIENLKDATITDSLISENSANFFGAGVYSSGALRVANSIISKNAAEIDGGGVYSEGVATIANSIISQNSASRGGGGIIIDGMMTITDSNISLNRAGNGGGALNWGTAMLENSTVSENSAEYEGGGVINDGTATITKCIISGNSANLYGGGIFSRWGATTIIGSNISGNLAGDGGGVATYYGGTAMITNSTISKNSAGWWGGGIFNDGMATITGSNISENQAEYGGGVHNGGTANILENSTITQNTADSNNDQVGIGGGIYSPGTLNFIDANGDGIVDPYAVVFNNHLGNGAVNNIEPLL